MDLNNSNSCNNGNDNTPIIIVVMKRVVCPRTAEEDAVFLWDRNQLVKSPKQMLPRL